MIQTIEIEVPKGKEAIYDETTQTVKFVNIKPIRSKSWEEFCRNNPVKKEYFITYACGIQSTDLSSRNCKRDRNFLKTKEDAEGILALIQLIRLHDEWVGDWKPLNTESSFAITYNLSYNCFSISDWRKTFHLLFFPTREMTEEFIDCFKDLIEKAKRFI